MADRAISIHSDSDSDVTPTPSLHQRTPAGRARADTPTPRQSSPAPEHHPSQKFTPFSKNAFQNLAAPASTVRRHAQILPITPAPRLPRFVGINTQRTGLGRQQTPAPATGRSLFDTEPPAWAKAVASNATTPEPEHSDSSPLGSRASTPRGYERSSVSADSYAASSAGSSMRPEPLKIRKEAVLEEWSSPPVQPAPLSVTKRREDGAAEQRPLRHGLRRTGATHDLRNPTPEDERAVRRAEWTSSVDGSSEYSVTDGAAAYRDEGISLSWEEAEYAGTIPAEKPRPLMSPLAEVLQNWRGKLTARGKTTARGTPHPGRHEASKLLPGAPFDDVSSSEPDLPPLTQPTPALHDAPSALKNRRMRRLFGFFSSARTPHAHGHPPPHRSRTPHPNRPPTPRVTPPDYQSTVYTPSAPEEFEETFSPVRLDGGRPSWFSWLLSQLFQILLASSLLFTPYTPLAEPWCAVVPTCDYHEPARLRVAGEIMAQSVALAKGLAPMNDTLGELLGELVYFSDVALGELLPEAAEEIGAGHVGTGKTLEAVMALWEDTSGRWGRTVERERTECAAWVQEMVGVGGKAVWGVGRRRVWEWLGKPERKRELERVLRTWVRVREEGLGREGEWRAEVERRKWMFRERKQREKEEAGWLVFFFQWADEEAGANAGAGRRAEWQGWFEPSRTVPQEI